MTPHQIVNICETPDEVRDDRHASTLLFDWKGQLVGLDEFWEPGDRIIVMRVEHEVATQLLIEVIEADGADGMKQIKVTRTGPTTVCKYERPADLYRLTVETHEEYWASKAPNI
jgi:hypothetical protein